MVNQLDLPMCYLMFKLTQFYLPHDFTETSAYKNLKIRFHINLAQRC